MSHTHSSSPPSADGSDLGYERSDVNVVPIVAIAVVCLSTVALSILGLDAYFVRYREQLLQEANRVDYTQLIEIRASEKEILTSYGVVDKGKGRYRIPIERAMSIIAEEAFRGSHGKSANE